MQRRSKVRSGYPGVSVTTAAGSSLCGNPNILGVPNEAVDAALDVGHLLQHAVHAAFIKLQTNES